MKSASDAGGLEPAATVAEGLWLRLRDAILAERRLEAFEFSPEGPVAIGQGALASLASDPDAQATLARDMTLRALAAVADPVNFRILCALGTAVSVPIEEVARRLGLPELATTERVHALAQAGLATRAVETHSVAATAAGCALAALIQTTAGALAERLGRELPALATP